jgi:Ca-activated chloride channel family protein
VILISDGQANVGPSSPFELGQVAATATAAGISATAIGVGLDYNEAVLDAVAMRSGGRFYHLTEAAELAMILQAELGTLEATVARGVVIDLVPAPGVEVLGATGAELTRQGNVVQLGVGDLSREQARQIILPVRVPTDGPSQLEAAAVNLRYRAAGTDEARAWSTQVAYGLTAAQAEADRGVRPEIAAAVEQYRASQAQLEAARLVGEGHNERAAALLEAQAAASERRAAAWSGTAAARVRLNTAQLRSRGQVVRSAGRGTASRAQQLGLNEEAMQNQGYR